MAQTGSELQDSLVSRLGLETLPGPDVNPAANSMKLLPDKFNSIKNNQKVNYQVRVLTINDDGGFVLFSGAASCLSHLVSDMQRKPHS